MNVLTRIISAVQQAVRPKKRVFGVGAAKTGTHSIASIFEGGDLTVEHEPNAEELIELALSRTQNPAAFGRSLRSIIERDGVSINVSQLNGYLIDDLYPLYPSAKYILTVRDAAGWVGSLLNHIVTRDCQPGEPWDRFRRLRFDRGHPFRPEDEWLEKQGLYPLDSLLDYWQAHTLNVLRAVPDEQLFVVPTLQIGTYRRALQTFAGSTPGNGQATEHAYRGVYRKEPQRFPPGYVEARCAFYSDSLMRSARQIVGSAVLSVLREALYPAEKADPIDRSSAVRQMMTSRSTDLERWAHVARETSERWDGRAKLAASLLDDQTSVLDLGCGAMTLERFLPAGVKYVPADCIRRDERTIVCDLNKEGLPEADATCVVALGLLEYIHDVSGLVGAICRKYPVLVCSYIPVDAVSSIDERRKTGWVNDYSLCDVDRMLTEAGFTKLTRERYLDLAWIWRAERADLSSARHS